MLLFHLATVLILAVNLVHSKEAAPIVTTKTGQVSGTLERSFGSKECYAFRRIPYAEPPIGDLRFRVNNFSVTSTMIAKF